MRESVPAAARREWQNIKIVKSGMRRFVPLAMRAVHHIRYGHEGGPSTAWRTRSPSVRIPATTPSARCPQEQKAMAAHPGAGRHHARHHRVPATALARPEAAPLVSDRVQRWSRGTTCRCNSDRGRDQPYRRGLLSRDLTRSWNPITQSCMFGQPARTVRAMPNRAVQTAERAVQSSWTGHSAPCPIRPDLRQTRALLHALAVPRTPPPTTICAPSTFLMTWTRPGRVPRPEGRGRKVGRRPHSGASTRRLRLRARPGRRYYAPTPMPICHSTCST